MSIITPSFGLIFWQFVTFIIVLLILRKYAWKTILSSLKQRDESINEALEKAELARRQTESLKMENEKLLAEARLEREKVLKDAFNTAESIRQQAKEEAAKISEKLINDARAAIEAEKNSALQEVKRISSELSIEIAEKLLRKNLQNQKEQKELVAQLINDIKIN